MVLRLQLFQGNQFKISHVPSCTIWNHPRLKLETGCSGIHCYCREFRHQPQGRSDRPMSHILPGITTLEQHLAHLSSAPDDYRPDCCPHCDQGCLWRHGSYVRQSDREHDSRNSLNPACSPNIPSYTIWAFVLRKCAHGKADRHRLIVVASKA